MENDYVELYKLKDSIVDKFGKVTAISVWWKNVWNYVFTEPMINEKSNTA